VAVPADHDGSSGKSAESRKVSRPGKTLRARQKLVRPLPFSLLLSFFLSARSPSRDKGGGRRVDRCGWRVCHGSSLERRPVCVP